MSWLLVVSLVLVVAFVVLLSIELCGTLRDIRRIERDIEELKERARAAADPDVSIAELRRLWR